MEWISVQKKFPEELQKVIVYDELEGIHITFFTWNVYECEDGGFDKYGFAMMDIPFNNITHWMPLPPKPVA